MERAGSPRPTQPGDIRAPTAVEKQLCPGRRGPEGHRHKQKKDSSPEELDEASDSLHLESQRPERNRTTNENSG